MDPDESTTANADAWNRTQVLSLFDVDFDFPMGRLRLWAPGSAEHEAKRAGNSIHQHHSSHFRCVSAINMLDSWAVLIYVSFVAPQLLSYLLSCLAVLDLCFAYTFIRLMCTLFHEIKIFDDDCDYCIMWAGLIEIPAAVLNETGLLGIRLTSAQQPAGSQPLVGVIDTGASFSIINWAGAQLLGLPSQGDRSYRSMPTVSVVGVDGRLQLLPTQNVSLTFCGDVEREKKVCVLT